MDKKELRRSIRERKRAMTEEEIVSRSEKLGVLFAQSEAYKNAKTIYGYLPYNQEVRTVPMLEQALKRKANKNIILGLSTTLVWFVALLVFVVLYSIGLPHSGLAFLYAIPVNAIVLLSLRSAWHDFRWNKALISTIVWGSLAGVYAAIRAFVHTNVWTVFLLGIPGQIAIFLWFRMFRTDRTKEDPNE